MSCLEDTEHIDYTAIKKPLLSYEHYIRSKKGCLCTHFRWKLNFVILCFMNFSISEIDITYN